MVFALHLLKRPFPFFGFVLTLSVLLGGVFQKYRELNVLNVIIFFLGIKYRPFLRLLTLA